MSTFQMAPPASWAYQRLGGSRVYTVSQGLQAHITAHLHTRSVVTALVCGKVLAVLLVLRTRHP